MVNKHNLCVIESFLGLVSLSRDNSLYNISSILSLYDTYTLIILQILPVL